jgi:hypothetical protein
MVKRNETNNLVATKKNPRQSMRLGFLSCCLNFRLLVGQHRESGDKGDAAA